MIFPGLFNSSLALEKSRISSDWYIKIRAKEKHNKNTYCCSQGPLKEKNNRINVCVRVCV